MDKFWWCEFAVIMEKRLKKHWCYDEPVIFLGENYGYGDSGDPQSMRAMVSVLRISTVMLFVMTEKNNDKKGDTVDLKWQWVVTG